jgi:hypothetical protein
MTEFTAKALKDETSWHIYWQKFLQEIQNQQLEFCDGMIRQDPVSCVVKKICQFD